MDPIRSIENELLVLEAQAGDRAAMDRLVDRWHGRLLRLARLLTGDQDGAADVTQEAWMGIVRGLRRLDDPAKFGPWAQRIVRRRAADWIRRRQRDRPRHAPVAGEAQAPPRKEADASDGGGDGEGEIELLRSALRRLPGDRRAMLSLLHVDGASVAMIATIFQIPPGTVKSRLHHARRELRETIERISHVEDR